MPNANFAADGGGYEPEAIKAAILAELADLKENRQLLWVPGDQGWLVVCQVHPELSEQLRPEGDAAGRSGLSTRQVPRLTHRCDRRQAVRIGGDLCGGGRWCLGCCGQCRRAYGRDGDPCGDQRGDGGKQLALPEEEVLRLAEKVDADLDGICAALGSI
jgi:hypothetical protein